MLRSLVFSFILALFSTFQNFSKKLAIVFNVWMYLSINVSYNRRSLLLMNTTFQESCVSIIYCVLNNNTAAACTFLSMGIYGTVGTDNCHKGA